MNNLLALTLKTAQLPSLPQLINDLQELIDKNEDLNVIANLLATDAGLSARVIELSNTAFYGNQEITRIFDAVHLIGLSKIIFFVRTAYTIEILQSVDGVEIDMRDFWKRSYTSALVAQNIASHIKYPQPDTIYTAGLFLNIGDIIFALLPEHMKIDLLTHHQIAAEQLSVWGFPNVLIESIRHCKKPSKTDDQFALPASIIHICDYIMSDKNISFDNDALATTQLTEEDIDKFADDMKYIKV